MHTKIRKKVLDNSYQSAARMSTYYNKKKGMKVQTFHIGEKVTVSIPNLDRSKTDVLSDVLSSPIVDMSYQYGFYLQEGTVQIQILGHQMTYSVAEQDFEDHLRQEKILSRAY